MKTHEQIKALIEEEGTLDDFIMENLDVCDQFEEMTEAKITGQGRWSTNYSQVYKYIPDGSFWCFNWSRGSTEYQDNGPEDVYFHQVYPHEETRIVYKSAP